MKKLIFCLMMLGLVHQADAQCKDHAKNKSSKAKKTAVAKKSTTAKKSVASKTTKAGKSSLQRQNMPTLPQGSAITNTNAQAGQYIPALPLRNSVIMHDVRPWAGFDEHSRESRRESIAVPLPRYQDVATPENMEIRGEGQIPHRVIDMRGTRPMENSYEKDLQILNNYDKMRGKNVR